MLPTPWGNPLARYFRPWLFYYWAVSEFAKNDESDLAEITDANACAGFSSCPEGDQMPMTGGYFNAAFKWACDKIEDLREALCLKVDNLQACFDALTGANIGAGEGLFAERVEKTFQFKSLIAGKGMTVTPSATDITIAATAYCCYSDASVPAGPPPAGFISSILVDDCTDPLSPIVYIWSCKAAAYIALAAPAPSNEAPPCSVHPAQSSAVGANFSYDASETDPENDSLTYTAQAPAWPTGFTIDSATGEITATNITAAGGMYVLNWTIDDGNNPPTACALSLTILAAPLGVSGEGTCDSDGGQPEPKVYCGSGLIPGTSTMIGTGITGTTCGVGFSQFVNTIDQGGETVITLTAPLPANLTEFTITNGSNSVVLDVSAFTGQTSFTIAGVNGPLHVALDGTFSIVGNC